jgi:hypothetical protein
LSTRNSEVEVWRGGLGSVYLFSGSFVCRCLDSFTLPRFHTRLSNRTGAFRASQRPLGIPAIRDRAAQELSKANNSATRDRAPTLLWSLDGVLRYVPIAALYDGQRYMVERFNNVLFTPESYGHMLSSSAQPAARGDGLVQELWRVAGAARCPAGVGCGGA